MKESIKLLALPESIRLLAAEATVRLQAIFGNDCTITIREVIDPEEIGSVPEYLLAVGTRLPAQEAEALLDKFCDDWWYKQTPGQLYVTVEFLV